MAVCGISGDMCGRVGQQDVICSSERLVASLHFKVARGTGKHAGRAGGAAQQQPGAVSLSQTFAEVLVGVVCFAGFAKTVAKTCFPTPWRQVLPG